MATEWARKMLRLAACVPGMEEVRFLQGTILNSDRDSQNWRCRWSPSVEMSCRWLEVEVCDSRAPSHKMKSIKLMNECPADGLLQSSFPCAF